MNERLCVELCPALALYAEHVRQRSHTHIHTVIGARGLSAKICETLFAACSTLFAICARGSLCVHITDINRILTPKRSKRCCLFEWVIRGSLESCYCRERERERATCSVGLRLVLFVGLGLCGPNYGVVGCGNGIVVDFDIVCKLNNAW